MKTFIGAIIFGLISGTLGWSALYVIIAGLSLKNKDWEERGYKWFTPSWIICASIATIYWFIKFIQY